jgi:GDPmannose 4,6-dehydratase
MFGAAPPPQNEETPFHPRSPYGAAKVYAYWVATNYREAYGMFCSNGVLFNHESPRRGPTFVTRKITRAVAHILAGKQDKLYLGNLEAKRDWGYAPEYVESMWQMLQRERPDDYALGTGESHTIREFVAEAFEYAGLDWRKHVFVDDRYKRPAEVDFLLADPKKAERELGWRPRINFRELVRIMVDADMESLGLTSPGEGTRILHEKFGAWHQWNNSVSDNLKAAAGGVLG